MKKILLLLVVSLFVGGCSYTVGNKTVSILDVGSSTPVAETGKILNLSHKNLTKVDMSVFDKTSLEELNVSYNNLTGALPGGYPFC